MNLVFYSLCDCLEISPAEAVIKPNSSKEFTIELTPEGYSYISRHFLVNINSQRSYIKVFANLPPPPLESLSNGCPECRIKELEIEDENKAKEILNSWIISDIYYSPGCKTCEDFLQSDFKREISFIKHNILEPVELGLLETKLKELDIELREFPILIYNNNVLQGSHLNLTEFSELTESNYSGKEQNTYKSTENYLKPIPIIIAGLLDGINPCAFTTLLFLISTLFYIGRGKKEILQIGIVFSITIFLTYYLVGLGLLNIVRTANFFPIIGKIIKYILTTTLIMLSILSFFDAYKIKTGKTRDIKLQLPLKIKKRLHSVIRENTREKSLILGTVTIGIMVTVFELSCTGQVYLPIIAYIIKIEGSISSYLYLTIYNLGFITPLLLVFIGIYKGITNQNLTLRFQNKLFLIKILLGLFFTSMLFFI